MILSLIKYLKIKNSQNLSKKTIRNYPERCPECGGWIDFKSNKYGKFYECRYCKWSCTGN